MLIMMFVACCWAVHCMLMLGVCLVLACSERENGGIEIRAQNLERKSGAYRQYRFGFSSNTGLV